MSLSLTPAANKKAYVFRMTERQMFVASKAIPLCLAASGIACVLIAAIGILAKLDFSSGWLTESLQTYIPIFLASLGEIVAFSELGLFLWVRFSPSSLLSEGQRKRLSHMALYRRISWMAYAAFLFALLSPCLGFLAVPASNAGLGWEAGVPTYFFMVQLGLIASVSFVFLVRRIVNVLSWKGLAK
jgi:hypothetical protein